MKGRTRRTIRRNALGHFASGGKVGEAAVPRGPEENANPAKRAERVKGARSILKRSDRASRGTIVDPAKTTAPFAPQGLDKEQGGAVRKPGGGHSGEMRTHGVELYASGGRTRDFKPGGRKGKLHRELGIPESEKIPPARLAAAARSSNPEVKGDAIRAETMKKWKH